MCIWHQAHAGVYQTLLVLVFMWNIESWKLFGDKVKHYDNNISL